MSGFTVQELIISGLYLYEARRILRRVNPSRRYTTSLRDIQLTHDIPYAGLAPSSRRRKPLSVYNISSR